MKPGVATLYDFDSGKTLSFVSSYSPQQSSYFWLGVLLEGLAVLFRFIYALCYVLIAYLVISNRYDLLISGILRYSFAVLPKDVSKC